MRYLIFDGGNLLSYPTDLVSSAIVGDFQPIPTAHQKRRTIEIEKHIDTASRNWRGHYEGLYGDSNKPLVIANGDEFGTHIVGRGWYVYQVAVHVKRVGTGALAPRVELDDGTVIPVLGADGQALSVDLTTPGHYIGFIVAPGVPGGGGGTGTPVEIPGQTVPAQTVSVTVPAQTVAVTIGGETVDVTVPAQTVDATVPAQTLPAQTVSVPGGAGANLISGSILDQNGVLLFAYDGETEGSEEAVDMDGCFGVYLSLIDYHDEHECECAPTPCATDFPSPECAPRRPAANTPPTPGGD